jgi:hypothetical protein
MIHREPSLEGFSMNRRGLRSEQFARIKKLLPGRPGSVGRDSQLGNRLFVEAVIWKFRTGVPWRDMSVRFGEVAALRNRPPGILNPTAKWALRSDVLLWALQTEDVAPHRRPVRGKKSRSK